MKIFVKILNFILAILCVGAVLLLVMVTFSPFKTIAIKQVISGSMEPKISTGSIIIVAKVDPNTIQKDNIINFNSATQPGTNITHRVAEVINKDNSISFKTKGDANDSIDVDTIPIDSVLGKVILIIPFLGNLYKLIKIPLGFVAIIVIPALYIIISEIINIKKIIETEAIRKYEKNSKKSIPAELLTIFIGLSLFSLNINTTNSYYSSGKTLDQNTFSTGCWAKPTIPELQYPDNNYSTIYDDPWFTDPHYDWSDSTTSCPLSTNIFYQYESYFNESLTNIAFIFNNLDSSNLTAPETPSGTYYWRVRACDSLNTCSQWSSTNKLIINSNTPPSELNPPESTINLDDIHSQNVHDFDIAVTATDDSSVKNIVLYYQFNLLGIWQTFPEIILGSSGNFHFTSPLGDGLYSFETIATDIYNNKESVDKFNTWNNQVKVDTIAPTTNLDNASLIDHIYYGQDYLINGKFENGMTGWNVDGSSLGNHHIANVGPTNISPDNDAFILGSETKSINGNDLLFQTVALPASASSTLSFSYRFLSHDTADFDKFTVNLIGTSGSYIFENILNVGNLETAPFDFDSGWRTLSRNINYLAGQTFKLLFTLIDTGEGDSYNSYVYLDNIKLSTLDLRIGETDTVSFLATDLGSFIINTPSDTTLNMGENILTFSSDDSSGNVENPNHQSILVMPPLVLNKIDKNSISIFNNQNDNIDLSIYSINTGTTLIPLSGTIFSQHSMDIILSDTLPDSCEIKLLKDSDIVDSTIITDLTTTTWQRQSDGLSPWVKTNTPVDFNLESRLSVSKIILTVSGLATTLSDMHYTIDYTDSSGPQEIYGQILSNTIDSNGTSARDFYLGTCSTGGKCIPSSLEIGTSFVVTFNGLTKTFIFN